RFLDLGSERRELVVHQDDAVFPAGDADVSAGAFQHVDGAGNLGDLDLDIAEILLLRRSTRNTGACRGPLGESSDGEQRNRGGAHELAHAKLLTQSGGLLYGMQNGNSSTEHQNSGGRLVTRTEICVLLPHPEALRLQRTSPRVSLERAVRFPARC